MIGLPRHIDRTAEKIMKKNIALTEMGVANPGHIARYTIYTVMETDMLRIIYAREKGSLLPVSKTYKFPRVKKSVLVDSGTRQTQVIFERNPSLTNAVAEIEELLSDRKDKDQLNQILADEILQLEAEMTSRIDYIKSLVGKAK
jgi:hypothetical protein